MCTGYSPAPIPIDIAWPHSYERILLYLGGELIDSWRRMLVNYAIGIQLNTNNNFAHFYSTFFSVNYYSYCLSRAMYPYIVSEGLILICIRIIRDLFVLAIVCEYFSTYGPYLLSHEWWIRGSVCQAKFRDRNLQTVVCISFSVLEAISYNL
jgi:hypothetical protein